jgi:hypothetical protein
MKTIVLCCILAIAVSFGDCGQCPNLPTIANFDPKAFSGSWYSIQESSPPRLPCLHYSLESTSTGFITTFLPYNAKLKATVQNPQDLTKGYIVGSSYYKLSNATWNIFATDYRKFCDIFGELKNENFTMLVQKPTLESSLVRRPTQFTSSPSLSGRELQP